MYFLGNLRCYSFGKNPKFEKTAFREVDVNVTLCLSQTSPWLDRIEQQYFTLNWKKAANPFPLIRLPGSLRKKFRFFSATSAAPKSKKGKVGVSFFQVKLFRPDSVCIFPGFFSSILLRRVPTARSWENHGNFTAPANFFTAERRARERYIHTRRAYRKDTLSRVLLLWRIRIQKDCTYIYVNVLLRLNKRAREF